MIVEENDCIPVWECFASNTVAEYHFLFTTQISSLNFSIIANYLVLDSSISWVRSTMIPSWHLHFVVLWFSFRILFFLLLLASVFRSIGLIILLVFINFRNIVNGLVLVLHIHFILNFILLPLEFFKCCLSLNILFGSLFTSSSKSLVEYTWTNTCLLHRLLHLLLRNHLLWLLQLLLYLNLLLYDLLSCKLLLSLITKLFIIVGNFVSKFCVLLPQITNLSGEPIDLSLLVLFLLHSFFSSLSKLLPKTFNLFTVSFTWIIGHCDILLSLFYNLLLLSDLLHFFFLCLLKLCALLLLLLFQLFLFKFKFLLSCVCLDFLSVQLSQFLVVILHSLIKLFLLFVKNLLDSWR